MQYANPMQLTARDPKSGLVRVVIDTPAGSRNKYKFDIELGVFKLSRILPAGMSFPFDFGSVPGTRAEDGDALDVLVISEAPLIRRLPGSRSAHRCGFERRKRERRVTIRNDRLVGSLETPVNKAAFRELSEVSREKVREIEHFFRSLNEAQGRQFKVSGRGGAKAAERILTSALQSHQ